MSVDPRHTPLKPADAKILARQIAEEGVVVVSTHARDAMRDDDLDTADCLNLLRAGVFEAPELVKDEWRYRVTTQRICIVLTFVSGDRLRLVTAWRIK
jgi:hypothetical protein